MRYELKNGAIESTLKDFGLTDKEVEVYIFLGKRGALKGGDITKQLRIQKGQVYRTLKSLQKKGLVEATLEYPTRFTAVPFEKLIDSFIESKREEVALIEEKKKDLLSDWNRISQPELDSSVEKFSVIEGNKKIFHKISQMVKETRSQFSMASTVLNLLGAEQLGVFDYPPNRSIKSKIQFRFLTQISKNNLKAVQTLKTKLNTKFDFKGINPSLGLPSFSRMAIRDNEEMVLFISDKTDESVRKGKGTCLCTNCKSIIQAFSGVFEGLWRDSVDIRHLIVEIETGKPTLKTQIIKDPLTAKKTYYEILNSAKEEIIIVTSSKGLIGLLDNKSQLKKWVDVGINIRVMSPITTESLEVTQTLLDYCEVRHIPVGYLETTIVDSNHLFQFRYPPEDQQSSETAYFENTFYTNDDSYANKTKNMLYDIWRKTRTPSSESIRSITRSLIASPKSEIGHHSLFKKTSISRNMKYQQTEIITEENVLDRIEKEKRFTVKGKLNWFNDWRFFGNRAFAVIHPPKNFGLPDMVIGIFHHDNDSSFGAENRMIIDLLQKTEKGLYYVPVAYVQDSSKALDLRKQIWDGFPVKDNMLVFKKDDFQVRAKGNTLFAGWTRPISLGPTEHILPPSCLLFEGYGDVKSGKFTNIIPTGRKQEFWFNSVDAFVSFFHPQSKYVGSGTDGFIERDSIFISKPVTK